MAISVTRFFRKNNKKLLAVFTVLLMVVFVLPQALQQMFQPDPTKQVVGEAYGRNIQQRDLMKTHQQLQILNELNSATSAGDPYEPQLFSLNVMLGTVPEQWRTLHYYLLIQEAKQMGIEISDEQVHRHLEDMKVPPALINRYLKAMSLKDFRRVIADYLIVEKAVELSASAIRPSDPELQHFFKMTHDRLTADILPLPADDFIQGVPEPTEEQLVSHFTEHRERFRYPNRIQVEYLQADLDRIKENITISEERARQYWQENKAHFTLTASAPADAPGDDEQAETQPIEVEMTFEQALPEVIDRLKSRRAEEQALRAMLEAKRQADLPWLTMETGEEKIAQRPETTEDYHQLADQISKQFHVPITSHRTPLVSARQAANLPGIGSAFIEGNRQRIFFSQYAFRVHPLIEPPATSDSLFLAPYENSVSLLHRLTPQGQVAAYYLFRVVDVVPAYLPESPDEVRAEVAHDYRLNQAYEIAKENARRISGLAGTETLKDQLEFPKEQLASIISQLSIGDIEPQTFARRNFSYMGGLVPPSIPQVRGDSGSFVDKVFETVWDKPVFKSENVYNSVVVNDAPTRTSYVVQVLEKQAGTTEEFDQFKVYLAQLVMMTRQQEFFRQWFSYTNVQQRTQFALATSQ